MKTFKNILGWCMLCSFPLSFFTYICISDGVIAAIFIFSISALLLAIVNFAVKLIVD